MVEAQDVRVLDGPWSRADVVEMQGVPRVAEEQEALEGIRRGDGAVFDRVCLAYHDALWRFAFRMVGSREVAQDVVQDVLVNLWERRADVIITTSLGAYLFSAVRRRALVYLRNDRTAARIGAGWDEGEVPGLGSVAESPSVAVERGNLQAMVARALRTLPAARRQAVALRWGEQMEYDEIAEAMGISEEAARAHVSRAYRTLRELLRAMGVEAP